MFQALARFFSTDRPRFHYFDLRIIKNAYLVFLKDVENVCFFKFQSPCFKSFESWTTQLQNKTFYSNITDKCCLYWRSDFKYKKLRPTYKKMTNWFVWVYYHWCFDITSSFVFFSASEASFFPSLIDTSNYFYRVSALIILYLVVLSIIIPKIRWIG